MVGLAVGHPPLVLDDRAGTPVDHVAALVARQPLHLLEAVALGAGLQRRRDDRIEVDEHPRLDQPLELEFGHAVLHRQPHQRRALGVVVVVHVHVREPLAAGVEVVDELLGRRRLLRLVVRPQRLELPRRRWKLSRRCLAPSANFSSQTWIGGAKVEIGPARIARSSRTGRTGRRRHARTGGPRSRGTRRRRRVPASPRSRPLRSPTRSSAVVGAVNSSNGGGASGCSRAATCSLAWRTNRSRRPSSSPAIVPVELGQAGDRADVTRPAA